MVFLLSKLSVIWVKILQLLVAGACLTVMVLIANLKAVIVNHNIEKLQIFQERSIHELKALWRKKWTIHIYVSKFRLEVIRKLLTLYMLGVQKGWKTFQNTCQTGLPSVTLLKESLLTPGQTIQKMHCMR